MPVTAAHAGLFYSPYCAQCRKVRAQLRALAAAWPGAQVQLHERAVLDELDRAVAVGVLRTPALAIDGRVIAGPLPSRRALEKLLRERVSNAGGESAHANS